MKKIVTYGLAALLGLGLSGNSLAAIINTGPFNGTDVGSVDSFLASTNELPGKGSNEENELAWLKDILGPSASDTEYETKTEKVSYFSTDSNNIFAFALEEEPSYFIIKNAKFWALFENVASLDWGVFNATLLPNDMNLPSDGFTISHVTPFKGTGGGGGGGGGSVPEPGMIALLGTGLLGFGLTHLRRRKKA